MGLGFGLGLGFGFGFGFGFGLGLGLGFWLEVLVDSSRVMRCREDEAAWFGGRVRVKGRGWGQG